jgi:lysophospholipase
MGDAPDKNGVMLMDDFVESNGLLAHHEGYVTMADGTRLLVRRLTTPNCNRTVVFIHGCGEYGRRYQHVAEHLVEAGWNVLTLDLRGHGGSEGTPTHSRNFDEYVNDLDTVLRSFDLSPSRTVLMGHSMGGLAAIRFAQTYRDRLVALVAFSPMLRLHVEVSRFTLSVGWLMSLVAPRTRFRSRVPAEHTTRNLDVLARRSQDPLLRKSVTAGGFFAMRRGMRCAWKSARGLQLPVLVLQAGQDRIAAPGAAGDWMHTVGSSDKSLMLFADAFHELLNEPDWRDTLDLAVQWLESRVPVARGTGSTE